MSCATAKKEGSSRYANSIRARSTRLAGSVRERAIAPNSTKSFSPIANSIACRHAVMSSTLSANQSRKPRTHVGKCESSTYDGFHGIDVLERGARSMSHHYSGPNFGFPRGDARLDFTDLYAFPKPGDAGKSILIMNAHPSAVANPPGPTTAEPFAPEALYELKIDTNGDAVADITYQVRFSSAKDGTQTATLRRIDASKDAATGNDGQIILEGVAVSTGRDARVTQAGDYRFFVGWRSDAF